MNIQAIKDGLKRYKEETQDSYRNLGKDIGINGQILWRLIEKDANADFENLYTVREFLLEKGYYSLSQEQNPESFNITTPVSSAQGLSDIIAKDSKLTESQKKFLIEFMAWNYFHYCGETNSDVSEVLFR